MNKVYQVHILGFIKIGSCFYVGWNLVGHGWIKGIMYMRCAFCKFCKTCGLKWNCTWILSENSRNALDGFKANVQLLQVVSSIPLKNATRGTQNDALWSHRVYNE